jgi:hypothetical protein
MNICGLGCGQVATFQGKGGNYRCASHHSKCPAVKAKIGEKNSIALSGKKQSPELVAKRIAGRAGVSPSGETRKQISQSNKEHWAVTVRVPWNKGLKGAQVAWNKGLRKREPLPIIPGDDPIYSDMKKYRNRVAVRTGKTYRGFKHELNPMDYPLGKCGVAGAYQIDHIISVREGFEKKIPVEVIAAKENLQVIPWLENIRKYDGTRGNS